MMARRAALGIAWLLTAFLGLLEAASLGGWLFNLREAVKWGAAENPYAAEDAFIWGYCSLAMLPLFLAALAWAVYATISWRKQRVRKIR